MSTLSLVDPQLRQLLEVFPRFQLSAASLPQVRAMLPTLMPPLQPDPAVDTSERRVPGPAGAPDVRVLVHRPKQPADGLLPAFFHIHGGGFVLGTPEGSVARNESLVRQLGCVVVSVDYRLAPETPFPGPVEDCHAALVWLHTHAAELGVDPARIAIGGESAGGGLTAALGLLARERAQVPVAFQLLIYPMLDDRTVTRPDPNPHTGEFVWTPENNRFGWASLLGREPGGEGVSAHAAPARAEDLGGLPPTFLAVGALDLFLEEDLEYARRLMRAGVPTELHVYPGAYHGFDLVATADVAMRFERDYRDALRRAFEAPPAVAR